jgi:hypothetical protein
MTPPYAQINAVSNPGITYSENLCYGARCSPSSLHSGFINADPQFVTPPYFGPSATGNLARPPPAVETKL